MCPLAPEQWLRGRLHKPAPDVAAVEKAASCIGAVIPRTIVERIRSGQPTHIQDVLTFSEATGVSLYQSFLHFGHDLEDLPLLQATLHRNRTVMLPATVYDHERLIDWPASLAGDESGRGEFLSELTSRIERRAVSAIDAAGVPACFYVRTGCDDTRLVPVVVPGTVLRINTTDRGPAKAGRDRPIYAVAHLRGLVCTYVDWLDERTIALVPYRHDIRPMICRLEDEAMILGRACAELRPTRVSTNPRVAIGHGHHANRLVRPEAKRQRFGRFLRSAREAIGMTHREAHTHSETIARAYHDPRFAIGVGTLSDWEGQDDLPLHVPHVFSLAACYAVSFGDLLRAGRVVAADPFPATSPASLIHAARIVANLPNLSWDDVFRSGNREAALDRSVAGARYLIVNRRDRRIERAADQPTIDRPLYILSDSQGRHVCSGCFVAGRHIYLQPDPALPFKVRALPRDRISIRGRVVAALREIEQIPAPVRIASLAPHC